jgi:hypothetical protein
MSMGYIIPATGENVMRISILVIVGLLISGSAMAADLVWSADPAAFERQVQRRYLNPFLSVDRRIVNQRQIDNARQKDLKDIAKAKREFRNVLDQVTNLAPRIDLKTVSLLRKRFDAMLERSYQIGGGFLRKRAPQILNLRRIMMNDVGKALKARGNLKAFKALEEAETFFYSNYPKVIDEFTAQMIRPDSPMKKSEIVASLLVEPPKTIIRFVKYQMANNSKLVMAVRTHVIQMLDQAQQENWKIKNMAMIKRIFEIK